jgi:hypothetical protein
MIRAVLAEHFARDRSAQQDGSADQSNPQRGFDQILFDVTRTRLRAEKRAIPTKVATENSEYAERLEFWDGPP